MLQNPIGNNKYCRLYLPLTNSVTEELSRGKSETHTVTNNGGVAITTVGGKKGAAFLSYDNMLSIPDSEDWSFGSFDFTISMFVNYSGRIGTELSVLIGCWNHRWLNDSSIILWRNNGKLEFVWTHSGSVYDDKKISIDWTPTIGTWYHIAVVRKDEMVRLFIDGSQLVIGAIVGAIYDSPRFLEIGNQSYSTGYNFTGFLSEICVSRGIARWTKNFTPPNRLI